MCVHVLTCTTIYLPLASPVSFSLNPSFPCLHFSCCCPYQSSLVLNLSLPVFISPLPPLHHLSPLFHLSLPSDTPPCFIYLSLPSHYLSLLLFNLPAVNGMTLGFIRSLTTLSSMSLSLWWIVYCFLHVTGILDNPSQGAGLNFFH